MPFQPIYYLSVYVVYFELDSLTLEYFSCCAKYSIIGPTNCGAPVFLACFGKQVVSYIEITKPIKVNVVPLELQ